MKNEVIIGDCAEVLKQFDDGSIDCIVTDPPYGYSFMGLEWDKALPSLDALNECQRVLKSGAFGFFMCAPRQDVLSRMIIRLEEAGFRVDFSFIGWSYASGFPKSVNISKTVDRRAGVTRKVIGIREDLKKRKAAEVRRGIDSKRILNGMYNPKSIGYCHPLECGNITAPATTGSKELDGSYGGFQPKPALECIITVMKPLSEKTYVDQALKNGKGITWLDDCKIPYAVNDDERIGKDYKHNAKAGLENGNHKNNSDGKILNLHSPNGRFPANLLVSDSCLDRGIITNNWRPSDTITAKQTLTEGTFLSETASSKIKNNYSYQRPKDSGDFSRYFSLDAWFDKKITELPEHIQKTFPFLITPKPSKSEKNKYIDNKHPTVKPLKLMSYLITLGSREGDVVLDPFAGSGTTLEACKLLNRVFIGIDKDPENEKYMVARGQLNTCTLNNFEEVV